MIQIALYILAFCVCAVAAWIVCVMLWVLLTITCAWVSEKCEAVWDFICSLTDSTSKPDARKSGS